MSGIRATVFANMVLLRLKREGWKVEPAEPNKKRRDLLVAKEGDDPKSFRVVPVFATLFIDAEPETRVPPVPQSGKPDTKVNVSPAFGSVIVKL